MNQDKIVDRIRKLMTTAKDQEGLPEGELAAKIAARLMAEHAVDMSQVEEKEKIAEVSVEVGRSNWARDLLYTVARFCSCKAWLMSGTREMRFAGYETDIEVCHYLFDLIGRQIEKESAGYLRLLNQLGRPAGKAASNAFKASAVLGVRAKLEAIRAAENRPAEGQDPGTSLVLVRSREVNEWVNARHNLVARSAPGVSLNASGYTAGQNVRLSPGIGSSGTPGRIGPAPKQLKG